MRNDSHIYGEETPLYMRPIFSTAVETYHQLRISTRLVSAVVGDVRESPLAP